MYSDDCFVDHIMALYLHSNEYKVLCKSAGVSPYAISDVILVKSFMMHMFCSFLLSHVCLYIVVKLTVLNRRS